MEEIVIVASERTPHIEFNFETGRWLMRGESYPEDAAAFYGPILQSVREFTGSQNACGVTLDLEMSYFNSSSAKALMNLFLSLEKYARQGREVVINWHYHQDDDSMQESGEDFSEDLDKAIFNLCPYN
jgi:hypothetical protein